MQTPTPNEVGLRYGVGGKSKTAPKGRLFDFLQGKEKSHYRFMVISLVSAGILQLVEPKPG